MLTGCVPYLEVFDMNASLAFYRDQLGFQIHLASPEVETKEGRFSHFVQLNQGHVWLLLNTAYDSNERPPDRSDARWAGCRHVHLYVDCDDVDGFHRDVTSRGLKAPQPALTGYGYYGFSVSDPDGYRLTLHQPSNA